MVQSPSVLLSTILGGYPVVNGATSLNRKVAAITTDTNTDLYTVQAGEKIVIAEFGAIHSPFGVYLPSGAGTVTAFAYVQFGGTGKRYRISGAAAVSGAFTTSLNIGVGAVLVLAAGDKIGVNTASSSASSLTASVNLISIPDSDPLSCAFLKDAPSGLSPIYTVPAGTVARPVTALVPWGIPQTLAVITINAQLAQNVSVSYNGAQIVGTTSASATIVNVQLPAGTGGLAPYVAGDVIAETFASGNTDGLAYFPYVETPA